MCKRTGLVSGEMGLHQEVAVRGASEETGLGDAWVSVSRDKGGCAHGLRLIAHTLLIPDLRPGRATFTAGAAPQEHVT